MKLNKKKTLKYIGLGIALRFVCVGYTMLEEDIVTLAKRTYRKQVVSLALGLGYNLAERLTPLTINQIIMREIVVNELNPAYAVVYKAVIQQESNGDSNAQSYQDARGLGQVHHTNAKYCGYTKAELFEDEKNLICGIRLFAEALKEANYDLILALKIYNAGAGRVDKTEENRAYPKLVLKRLKELR